MIKVLTANSFNDEIVKDSLVLVDFYADWCGPCKMFAPIMERVSNNEKYSNVSFCKINIDENSEVASEYQIMSIPSLFAFKKGKVIDRSVGLLSESDLMSFINKNL